MASDKASGINNITLIT